MLNSGIMSNWKEVVGDLYIKDKPVVNLKFQRKKYQIQKERKTFDVETFLDLIWEDLPRDEAITLINIRKNMIKIIDKKFISEV